MKISLQNIEYKNYNLQKTNQQKASNFVTPEFSTSSLDTLANYNKANVHFKGAISEIYNRYKTEKDFATRYLKLKNKVNKSFEGNNTPLLEYKYTFDSIAPYINSHTIDLVERIFFDDTREEHFFKNDSELKSAIQSLNEYNVDLAERLFFPDEETKEMIRRNKAIDLTLALYFTREENHDLAEALLFGKNEKYEEMQKKYKEVHYGKLSYILYKAENNASKEDSFLYRPFSDISKEAFPRKDLIHDILNRTDTYNLFSFRKNLAYRLCLEKDEDGNDVFPLKDKISGILRETTKENVDFVEKLCFDKNHINNADYCEFIEEILDALNEHNISCAEELFFGTDENDVPIIKNKDLIKDILPEAKDEESVRKLNALIDLLKKHEIPEESIALILKGEIKYDDYQRALDFFGRDKIFSLEAEYLYSYIKFIDLYKMEDTSELSNIPVQNRKKILKAVMKEGVDHIAGKNRRLRHTDFPLLPIDVRTYSKLITGLTDSINIKTEKLSQQEEEAFYNSLFSLSTKLANISDKEFTLIENPLENKQLEKDLKQILSTFPELNEIIDRKQHSTHDFNVFKHSLKVMQKIVQNPSYKKLNDSDKKILLLASLFHDFSKEEGVRDKHHAENSAFDTFFITQKLNFTKKEQNKLYTIIKNHEWLNGITSPEIEDKDKETKSIAYDLQYNNLFELSKIFTEADLKAVKCNNDFYKKKEYPFAGYIYKIDRLIDELKNTQPLLPITPIPSSTRIKQAIKKVYENGKTNLKGIYQDKNGMVIIRYNEVENETWEKIGFPKGSISKGIDASDKKAGEINTGNIKFFAHGFDLRSDLQNFDAFTLPDSDALLSVSYAERPESKYRFFRTQGVLINTDAQYIHGGGKTDSGSGCKKTVEVFKQDYAFPDCRRYEDRIYISELIKKQLKLFDGQYRKLVEENASKPLSELKPEKYQEKIIKALARINSHTRFGERSYNEMYISNPEVMAVYAYPSNNEVKDTMRFVDKQKDFIKEYAVEKDIPLVILGD